MALEVAHVREGSDLKEYKIQEVQEHVIWEQKVE